MKKIFTNCLLILSVLLFPVFEALSAVVTSTSTGGNWSSTSTWLGGVVPGGSDVVIISTTGGNAVIVDANTESIQSLTINSGAILLCNSNVMLSVGKGTGIDVVNNGTMQFTDGTFKLANNSSWDGTGNWNLYHLDLGGRNLIISFSSYDTLHFSGSTDPITNGGTLNPGTNSVFDFNGSTSQDFPVDNNMSFYDVQFNNGSGVNLTRNISTGTVAGNLTISSGAVSMAGFTITGNAGKSFIMNASTTLNCNVTFPSGFSTYSLDVGSTVIYNSSGSQTISSTPQYGNLHLATGGIKTAGGALTVNGNFQLSGSTAFNGGTSLSHTFKGNWTNNSSSNPSFSYTTSSTITLSTPSTPAATSFGGTTPAATAFNNLVISNTGGVTVNRSVTASGTLTISSNTTLIPSDSVTMSGTGGMTVNGTIKVTKNSSNLVGQYTMSGTKTLTGGTVDFSGTTQTVDNLSYKNLTISGSATLASTFSVVPSGIFSITGTATFGANQTTAFGGNTIVSGSGILDLSTYSFTQSGKTLTLSSGGMLKIGGTNGLPTFGTYSLTGGTVEFYGTTQSIAAQTYGNLTISGSRGASNVTLASGTINISSTFNPSATFSSGNYLTSGNTVNYNGSGAQTISAFNYNNLTSSSSGSRTLASSGTIGIKGNFNTGTNSYTITGSTIDFNGGGMQTIPAFNYYNLTSSNSGDRILAPSGIIGIVNVFTQGTNFFTTSGSTIDFNGSGSQTIPSFTYFNLTCSNIGSRILDNTATIYIEEIFTPGANSYTVTGSTVEYMSTSAQTIAGFDYNNLTIAGNGTKTASDDISVSGILSLNNDLLNSTFTLTMGNNSTTIGTSEVIGTVRRTSFITGTEYSFGSQFTTITFASGTLPSQIDVTINTGAAHSNKTDAVLRYYDIDASGGSNYSSTLRVHYLDGELNGNTSSQLSLWQDDGSVNDRGRTGAVNTTDKWAELSGVTSFSIWTLANASLDHFNVALSSPQTNNVAFVNTNTITAKDQNENTITIFDASANNVTVSLSPLDGSIFGLGSGNNNILDQAGDFANGVADVTSELLFIGTSGDHVFTATSSNGKTGSSGNINIQVGAPVRLAFSTEPGNGIADSNLSVQPVVTVQDTGGNTVTTATNAVALSIETNPSAGVLSATTNPLNAISGNANFSGVKINQAGSGYTLNATATGLTAATSSAFTINNPTPVTSSISPTNKVLGDGGFTITVNGTHFVSTSVVQFGGNNRSTTFVNDNQLTAQILSGDLTTSGAHSLTVFNPTPGGGTSNTQTFTVLTGSISGVKFNDTNGNGIQNGGESLLQNWRIRLSKNGSDYDSVLTDVNGNYSFTNLGVGSYVVSENVQSGWLQTLPTSPSTYSITIQSGQTEIFTGRDFGNFQYGSISGVKFHDLNGNGAKDIGEGGLQNWKIKLAGAIVDSVLTDVNGNYSFTNLTAGNYTVNEVLQSGWLQTLPANSGNYALPIASGNNYTGKDFGNFQRGIISGQKFNDLNGNGAKDGGEAGLQNWKIKLTGAATESVMTDVSGNYSFANLGPGSYTVSEETQSGWLQTVPLSPGTYSLNVISGSNFSGNNFGNFQYGTISGTKFNDANGNGVKDGGEAGIQNWKIRLSGVKTDSANTDVNGNYSFTQLNAGNYTVAEDAQNGWLQTLPASGGNYSLTITSGSNFIAKDFGNFQLGSISGQVYNDIDGDSVKDAGEPGLQNWKIRLSGAKTDSVFSDASGNYSFTNLVAGNYAVSEVVQSGWIQTSQPTSHSVAVVSGTVSTGNIFGNFQLGVMSGIVFNDINGDGIKDNGESGTSGWKIHLTGTKIDSVVSDVNGVFSFTGLLVGPYAISESPQSGFYQTLPAQNIYRDTVSSGTNATGRNFGNYLLGIVSGTAFNDLNGNAAKDIGEVALQNWKIYKNDFALDSTTTDVNGLYTFAGLRADGPTVLVYPFIPSGWIQTLPVSPSYSFSIYGGANFQGNNIGLFELGNISGQKFNDVNGNGVKDGGESALQNWKIRLSGAKVDSVVTDASGNYSFNGLTVGNYNVSEDNQSGWLQTLPAGGGTYSISVQSGTNSTARNFGNFQYGIISGMKFGDANSNGVKDVGEVGLANWKIKISGAKNDSVLTDGSGNYTFTNLTAGNYTVSEVLQSGWVQTFPLSPGTYSLSVVSGSNFSGNDFGNFQIGSISGTIFEDVNGNGVKDGGEIGIPGWRVRLSGTVVDSVLADAGGNYSFINLSAGTYTVSEAQQSGWLQTMPVSLGTYTLSIVSGTNHTAKDFGNFQYGSISGKKFNDANGNGSLDNGEAGLANWKIKLSGAKRDSVLTDDNGNYSFTNLTGGNYTIGEESQSGWLQTLPASPGTYSQTINSGTIATAKDFGNFQYGIISGTKFNDADGDGIKDGGESGIQNWKIKLTGTKSDSVVTDASGNYSFTNLTVGNYTVSEVQQSGWLQTLPVNNGSYNLTVVSGSNHTVKDFGNFLLGIISGEKFNDVNANGIKDNGENGIQNWKIKLSGAKTDSVLTDANGNYSFAGLLVGNYTVSEVLQTGWVQIAPGNPGTFSYAVASGSNFSGNAFGNFQLGSISGMKFNDVNGNGVKDNGEIGLQNWKIKLNGMKTDSVLTDANGNYSFVSLLAGNYNVSEVSQSGWLQTLPVGGSYDVSISSGSVLTAKDFGNYQYGAISGTKFNDMNGNGIKENGEAGLQNWKIKLSGAKIDSVLTDASGNYSFTNLTFGDYVVSEINQSGWMQTLPSSPSTYSLSVVSGTIFITKDFGNFQLGSISGMKYNDANGNGQRDNDENGLVSWKIKLAGAKTDSTQTDESGNYSFSGLLSGDYVVSEQQQSGWLQTMPSTPGTYTLTIVSGSILIGKDFGNLQLSTISGTVFLDQNGDGVKDNGEVGLAGWKIRLTGNKIDSAISDANGNYILNSIQAGNYVVSEVLQEGWIQTLPANNATYPITLTPGLNETGKDFGNAQLGTISGLVFNDMNGNGMIENGEGGFQGWKIKISGAKSDSTTTNANGAYTITNIPVGTYTVKSVGLPGYTLTAPVSPGTYSPITIESGSNFSGLNFGYFGGATKYRTYRATTDLSFKAVKLKFKKNILTSSLPNLSTTVENVFKKIGKNGATFLGVKQIDKVEAKKYGWIAYKKAADLAKLYTQGHNSTAFPIDYLRIPGKPDKKLVKAITANRTFYNNIAFEQGVLFKLNIIASDTFITPHGFGNLLLDTTYTLFGRQLEGMTLQQISVYFDTLMTYWQSHNILSNTEYSLIGDFVTKILTPINERFSVTMDSSNYFIDSVDVINKKNTFGVRLLGYKTAAEVGLVRQIPGTKHINADIEFESSIPDEFALHQNYPNPFNPITTIRVDLPRQSVVSLKIYDAIGREVITLADNDMYNEGTYDLIFNAERISSGMYFYRLDVNNGEYVQTRKLTLLK